MNAKATNYSLIGAWSISERSRLLAIAADPASCLYSASSASCRIPGSASSPGAPANPTAPAGDHACSSELSQR